MQSVVAEAAVVLGAQVLETAARAAAALAVVLAAAPVAVRAVEVQAVGTAPFEPERVGAEALVQVLAAPLQASKVATRMTVGPAGAPSSEAQVVE